VLLSPAQGPLEAPAQPCLFSEAPDLWQIQVAWPGTVSVQVCADVHTALCMWQVCMGVAQACSPSTQEVRQRITSSRPAWAVQ
jgi:hypothetical protein